MLERILSDWPVKLLSLGLAFAIWVSITGEKRIPVNFEIALDPQLRADHILAQTPPSQVTVRMVGPESVMRKLDPLEMTVRLDMTKSPPGEREVQLTEAHLKGNSARVEVEFFDPDRIQLVVDERQRRQLPVTPNLIDELPDGYTMYQARVRPDMVLVEGPAKEVSTLTHVKTDPVTLGERTRRFIESVGAVPDRPHVRIVNSEKLEVRVDVDVSPIEKTFEDLPVVASTRTYDATLNPETADVTLSGPPLLLERVTPQQIQLTADVSELAPASGQRRVPLFAEVDLPTDQQSRVSVKAVRPHQVVARLSEKGESE